MIRQFGPETALLLIDVQKGVNVLEHWGGPTGRRNNPGAEAEMAGLLAAWRDAGLPVIYTQHDSREAASPLKLSLPTGAMIEGFEPAAGEIVIRKDVNSAFIGTDIELRMRQHGITRLVIVGFFTNFCVETSTRMAGNMGYDTYLVPDACATTNRVGPDGTDHDPETVHALSVASLHGEFCTAISTDQALALTKGDAPDLTRVQGNE
ncbi:cysteine hydrolase family protein [Roseovarius indicus]|uniref:Isochorismatase n=1 Tax=Roseovarius indicus TaxID=540747 RepID=A0A0T5P238_9RHOB|nr:cysteine hydrolase family protein [Roseovarius indicus]KRS15150.1 isochorismatase [Roseovarius indicus]QEW24795.1 Isochorismatase family protein YecD [Roseovarius indicus]SFE51358.1 Nicotinamidase-related amidase [Roseovarius indicus]